MFKVDKKVIIIIILLGLNITLLFSGNRSSVNHQDELADYNTTIQIQNMLIKNISYTNYLSEKFKSNLNAKSPVIKTEENQKSCLDLCEDEITFFLRFSNEACSSCVTAEIKRLRQIKGVKTICLVTTNNPKNIHEMDFLVNSGLEYYYLPNKMGLTELEEEKHTPFIFIIKNNILHSLFIPIKEEPTLSEQFYKYYNEKYR